MAGAMEDLDTVEPLAARLARHGFDRLIMLSDGVFAIAITLAALEIRPPHGWRDLHELWRGVEYPLFSYLVSFMVIAIYWMAHRDTFARLRRADSVVTAFTLLLLLTVALIPAATSLIYDSEGRNTSIQGYACVMIACGLAQSALWAYAAFRPGLMLEGTPSRYRWARFAVTLIMPAFFATILLGAQQGLPGQTLLIGAVAFAAVMMLVRRVVMPRLMAARQA